MNRYVADVKRSRKKGRIAMRKATIKEELKLIRAAGWTPVSRHIKSQTANAKAKAILQQMFRQGKVLPEVKIFPVGKKLKVVAKRYRKHPTRQERYLHAGR